MKKVITMCLLMGLAFAGMAQQDEKALAILEAMSAKYKKIPSFKANFVYKLENPQAKINEDFKGEIVIKGDKYWLKMGGQEIINNGKTVWTYLADVNEVNIDHHNPNDEELTPSQIYDAYKSGYKYYLMEEKTEAGKTISVIDLVPDDKNLQYFKVRLEINKKDATLMNWSIFAKNGNRYTYQIDNFDPNFKATDSFFSFDPSKYKGVEIIDLR